MAKSFELPQYSSSGSTLDRAFTAMLGTESNHRQLDNQGNPITSPKGAIGVAQVMPSTAPEAAKLAGLAWDEQATGKKPVTTRHWGKPILTSRWIPSVAM